jgi:hypothetical protein
LWACGCWWNDHRRWWDLYRRWSSSQLKFLLLKGDNKCLNQGDALLRVFGTAHEEFVVPVLLEFLGLLAKCASNAFAELQLCSGPSCIEIGETFSAKVFHLGEEFLELADAASKVFDRGGFGSGAGVFGCFCSCHGVWEKSSPASTTWQENMGKRAGTPVEAGRCVRGISHGLVAG